MITTASMIHQDMSLSVLPCLMKSPLKNVIKKIAFVNLFSTQKIGFYYVDDHDEIFTLNGKPSGHPSLDQLIASPQNYLNQITPYEYSFKKPDKALTVVVKPISHFNGFKYSNFSTKYEDWQSQESTNSITESFPDFFQLELAVNKIIDELIKKELGDTNTMTDNISETKITNLDCLQLLSHYMFEFNDEQYFFTNSYTEWYQKMPGRLSQDKRITVALQYWNATDKSKSKLADPFVASFVLQRWDSIFDRTSFMRKDGALKRINARAIDITILPSAQTAQLTNNNITGNLIITSK